MESQKTTDLELFPYSERNPLLDATVIEAEIVEHNEVYVPMNKEEATELTNLIVTTGELLYGLVYRAWKGRAWEAMGYDTFEEWGAEELSSSRSKLYRLVNLGKVQESVAGVIEATRGEMVDVKITQDEAQKLAKVLPEFTEAVEEALEENPEVDPSVAVRNAIAETVPQEPPAVDEVDSTEYLEEPEFEPDTNGTATNDDREKVSRKPNTASESTTDGGIDVSGLDEDARLALNGNSDAPAVVLSKLNKLIEKIPSAEKTIEVLDLADAEYARGTIANLKKIKEWTEDVLDEWQSF